MEKDQPRQKEELLQTQIKEHAGFTFNIDAFQPDTMIKLR